MPFESSKPSILIVDDEGKLSHFLFMALQKLKYNVMVCDNVAEARQKLLITPCHLVLSDIIMPGENGFSLARWVKQIYPDTIIVLMTAHATESIMLRAIQVGVADVLEKPFSIDKLEETINRLIPVVGSLPEKWSAPPIAAYTIPYVTAVHSSSQFEMIA